MSNESLRSSGSDTEPDIEIMDAEESLVVERVPKAPQMLRLGRYRIVCELASGGMATVNLAVADGLDKLLALKVIHPHLAKEEPFVRMFLDEARIASSVSHRNVCNVFDYGEQDGSYYMAMDYLAGSTLRDVMQRLRGKRGSQDGRSPVYLAYIMAQACEGLHAAHELRGNQGELLEVVHRDVSPHNLFVTYDGNVSVVDFGIARASDRLQQTATGVLKGKFSYMAPEQIRQTKIDRRADIWALGVCLWEALTQRRLFVRGTQADTLMSVMMDPIKRPSELASDVAPELDEIVLRALARNPDERYRSAREMGRDLTAFCRDSGISVGNVEIEHFMQELFPKELVQSRDLVRRAKRAAQDENEIYLGGPSPTHSGAMLRPTLQRALAGTHTGSYSGAGRLAGARSTAVPSEPKTRSRGFLWGAVCAGLISAGFFIGLNRSEPAVELPVAKLEPAEHVARSAPAASAPAPTTAPAPQRAPEPVLAVVQPTVEPLEPAVPGPAPTPVQRAVPQPSRAIPARVASPRQRAHEIIEAAQAETAPKTEARSALAAAESESADLRPDAAAPVFAAETKQVVEAAPPVARAPEPVAASRPAAGEAASKGSAPKPDNRPLDANVSFGEIQTVGSLGPAVVSRMLNRTAPLLRSCYQSAARSAGRNDFSSLSLSFTIDETGGLRSAKASSHGLSALPGCASDALKRVRADQKPDVGTVKVQVQVSFRSL
jgi:eukaryotic-like serine/threonine-protein kinase